MIKYHLHETKLRDVPLMVDYDYEMEKSDGKLWFYVDVEAVYVEGVDITAILSDDLLDEINEDILFTLYDGD